MAKSPVSDRMAKAEARYGKTTKGTAEKPRPKTTVKPTGSMKRPGIKVEHKW
ncbi:MAG: hypothetical protein HC889_18835 [Synechococcaceae cyanobacterium SM1_2_3]|nr:hypothetical protein [Synechococcaceae cyanobacterium SM1_2_3]